MPARAFCLLRENRRQPCESLHSNSLMVKEQKWLNTKRRNSWAWMSDDKCISTRWHFHHYLIDHLGDILNCGPCVRLCVCVICRIRLFKKCAPNKHTHALWQIWVQRRCGNLRLLPWPWCVCATDLSSFFIPIHTYSSYDVEKLPHIAKWLKLCTCSWIHNHSDHIFCCCLQNFSMHANER